MAIALDTTAGTSSASASSLTFSMTLATGASLLVGAGSRANVPPTGVTYNGVSLTQIVGDVTVHSYVKATPSTGAAYNVVVSFTGTGNCSAFGISVTGADRTSDANLVDVSKFEDEGSVSSYSVTSTTTTDNCFLVDNVVIGCNGTFSGGETGQTEFFEYSSASHSQRGSYRAVGAAGNYTMSGSQTCTNDTRVLVVGLKEGSAVAEAPAVFFGANF